MFTLNPLLNVMLDLRSQVFNKASINLLIGYSGYVPGVKSENVFGESFGKTSGLSGNG